MVYLEQIDNWSQIAANIILSIGAIVGIYFGAGELRARRKISRLKKKFPLSQIGQDYKLVDTPGAPGKIYIVELRSKKRYWVQNSSTFADLGFIGHTVTRMPQKELNSYKESDKPRILTRGVSGT